MKDIIEETEKKYNKILLREATGTIERGQISLRLEFNERFRRLHYWVLVYEKDACLGNDHCLEMKSFKFHFFANKYFNKLVRRHILEENK